MLAYGICTDVTDEYCRVGESTMMECLKKSCIAIKGIFIWYIFFGLPGSNIDITILNCSPLIHNKLIDEACDVYYVMNGYENNRYYLLVDGVYP